MVFHKRDFQSNLIVIREMSWSITKIDLQASHNLV